jgi:hypothetical protein
MLNFTIDLFNKSSMNSLKLNSSNVPISKLLIILSDGKGIFYEGIDKVKNAVQNALQNGLFILFIILDTSGKNSIFDIKMPIFTESSPVSSLSILVFSFNILSKSDLFLFFFSILRFQQLNRIWRIFHFLFILF